MGEYVGIRVPEEAPRVRDTHTAENQRTVSPFGSKGMHVYAKTDAHLVLR
jgi:hypothetical protein